MEKEELEVVVQSTSKRDWRWLSWDQQLLKRTSRGEVVVQPLSLVEWLEMECLELSLPQQEELR